MTRNQFLNILAFLTIMSNEFSPGFLCDKSPEYIIEKWTRYIGDPPRDDPCYNWGMFQVLRKSAFDAYVNHWGHHLDVLFPAGAAEL